MIESSESDFIERMVKLRELVVATSRLLGEPSKSVNVRAMQLRKSGLIHSGGRGLSAAEMGPSDAANLIIACLSGGYSTDAAKTTLAVRGVSLFQSAADPKLIGLEALPANFGEALDAVLAAAPTRFVRRLSVSIGRDSDFWKATLSWRMPHNTEPNLVFLAARIDEQRLLSAITSYSDALQKAFEKGELPPKKPRILQRRMGVARSTTEALAEGALMEFRSMIERK